MVGEDGELRECALMPPLFHECLLMIGGIEGKGKSEKREGSCYLMYASTANAQDKEVAVCNMEWAVSRIWLTCDNGE